MAKIKLGPMVGQASGAIGATVFSHNRYGAYVRQRVIPTISTTAYALAAKAALAAVSAAWGTLTDAQRTAWQTWAANNPMTDRLGDRQVLTGHAAYVQINGRLTAAGQTNLAVPPIGDGPLGITSASLVADIGPGGFVLTFAATPLAATEMMELRACVVPDDSINYVKNYLRQVGYSAAAQATDWDFEPELTARFGTLQVDQWVHCMLSVLDNATGLRSQPFFCKTAIVDTTA